MNVKIKIEKIIKEDQKSEVNILSCSSKKHKNYLNGDHNIIARV